MVKAKTSVLRDALREIGKTKSRFVSIMAIVAIGVGLFAGVRAASPDMERSADSYFDKSRLMDFRLVSTLGFDEKDIRVIASFTDAEVLPSYFYDALLTVGSREVVGRMIALPGEGEMNQIALLEGRLPEKDGECVAERSVLVPDVRVGDTIKVKSGNQDEDVGDMLSTDEFVIVGLASSPMYIAESQRGNTTIGQGTISMFVYLPKGGFAAEVYTEVYLRYDDLADLNCYGGAYQARIGEIGAELERLADVRAPQRYEEIVSEADGKLSDAEKELSDAKAEAEKKLSDAKTELSDADGKLADARERLDEGQKEIRDGERELQKGWRDYDKSMAEARDEIDKGRAELEDGQKEYGEGLAEYNDGKDQVSKGRGELEAAKKELDQGRQALDAGRAQLAAQRERLSEIQSLQGTIGGMSYAQAAAVLGGVDPGLAAMITPENYQTVAPALLGQAALKMEQAISQAQDEMGARQWQLDEGYAEYEKGALEIRSAEDGLALAELQLMLAKEKLDKGYKELSDAEQTLERERQKALDELYQAEEDIRSGKEELAGHEREYQDGLAEYQDGLSDYEEGKREADEKIIDAEAELADARREVEKLKAPEWYVLSREDNNPGYAEYGENANRIANIAKVFPAFLVLIAALVCLTTMSRMIAEQRMQIGTMKALGYGNAAIMFKYMCYAVVATLAGCLAGLTAGFKLLPWVIFSAYNTMYDIPELLSPFIPGMALSCTAVAVACIIATVYYASRKEFSRNPARLMRPKSPKSGKRVLLERIPLIWKRLNFSQKVSARNVFRYKGRMAMTIVGIAGCTALMLTGFALRDSIFDIAAQQFGPITKYSMLAVYDQEIRPGQLEDMERTVLENTQDTLLMRAYLKNVTATGAGGAVGAHIVCPAEPERFGAFIHLRDRTTRQQYALDDSGAVVTEKLAKLLDIRVGDTIELANGASGAANVRVLAVAENYVSHYVYLTPGLYREAFGQPAKDNALFARYSDLGEDDEKALSEGMFSHEDLQVLSFTGHIREDTSDMLKSLGAVTAVMILSAGALAFVVLYNLTNINLTERVREIATLKVLGFYDKEVSSYVSRENIILTVIGIVAGLGLGVLLSRYVIMTAEIDAVMFGRRIYLPSYIYASLTTMAFSALVSLVMHRKLNSIDMVESLKSVE